MKIIIPKFKFELIPQGYKRKINNKYNLIIVRFIKK